jgi:L-arabinose isomerase
MKTGDKTMTKQDGKIGLLPLYLKLYDERDRDKRPRIESFYEQIASELEKRKVGVVRSPICRTKSEFEAAVRSFEDGGAEAIVTLHLAYSPSLESADALARTSLPIVVCDTTPTYSFGPDQNPEEIMYNHGIHGVQDMCNLLVRRGKPFHIEAGHWQKSDVLDRVVRHLVSARMAHRLRTLKAGLVGEPFEGMGDFYVSPADLKATLGVETRVLNPPQFKTLLSEVTEKEIQAERDLDEKRFTMEGVNEESYRRSVRNGLALQKWIDKEGMGAFSFNFLQIGRATGLETAPFLQASKLMARGVGFGGEGDLLTASLVCALAAGNPETSFSEMFCPDWKNGSVFLSHMGEMNWKLAAGKPRLLEMDYQWSDAANPVYVSGCFKAGEFVLVDLLPLEPLRKGAYRLIIAPAKMLDVPGKDSFGRSIHGWFKPGLPVAEFLAEYSRAGGTHHLAISYGLSVETVEAFGRMMGWETVVIR